MLNTEEALALLLELPTDADGVKALDAIIKAAPSAATATLIRQLDPSETMRSANTSAPDDCPVRLTSGVRWTQRARLSSSTSTRSCCSESAIQDLCMNGGGGGCAAAATTWLRKSAGVCRRRKGTERLRLRPLPKRPGDCAAVQVTTTQQTLASPGSLLPSPPGASAIRRRPSRGEFHPRTSESDLRRRGLAAIAYVQTQLLLRECRGNAHTPVQAAGRMDPEVTRRRKTAMASR